MTNTFKQMTATNFKTNLAKLAQGRKARYELMELMLQGALYDISTANNYSKLTQLVLTNAISPKEKGELRGWLLDTFNIAKVYLTKSKKGEKVVKIATVNDEPLKAISETTLLDFANTQSKKEANPFDEAFAIASLKRLVSRCIKAGLDVSKVLASAQAAFKETQEEAK